MERKSLIFGITQALVLFLWSIMVVVVPFVSLTWGRALNKEIYAEVFKFYIGVAIGMGVLISMLKLIQVVLRHLGYEKGIYALVSKIIIHNPKEDGFDMGGLTLFIQNPLKMWMFSVVIFSFSTFITASNAIHMTAIPKPAEMAVTELGELGMVTEPASTAETLMLLAIIFIIYSLINYVFKRYGIYDTSTGRIAYWIIALVILPILGGFFWYGIHTWRYGAEETSMLYAFMFGALQTFITNTTGSIIPALVFHETNNLFIKMLELYSSDKVLLFVIVIFILFGSILSFLILRDVRKRKFEEYG